MNNAQVKLLPCPFCGEHPTIEERDYGYDMCENNCTYLSSSAVHNKPDDNSFGIKCPYRNPECPKCYPKPDDRQLVEAAKSEEERQKELQKLIKDLPPIIEDAPLIWSEDEIKILRAACKARFNEDVRTETLFTIASAAIRIFKNKKGE